MDLSKIQGNLLGKVDRKKFVETQLAHAARLFFLFWFIRSQVAKGTFLTFDYTWEHENVPQEGMLLVGYDRIQNIATAAWIDTWHMSSKVMFCQGTINALGIIDPADHTRLRRAQTGDGELWSPVLRNLLALGYVQLLTWRFGRIGRFKQITKRVSQ